MNNYSGIFLSGPTHPRGPSLEDFCEINLMFRLSGRFFFVLASSIIPTSE